MTFSPVLHLQVHPRHKTKKLRVKGSLFQCRRCKRRYTNLLTHRCVVRFSAANAKRLQQR
jgi:hypothetical protein